MLLQIQLTEGVAPLSPLTQVSHTGSTLAPQLLRVLSALSTRGKSRHILGGFTGDKQLFSFAVLCLVYLILDFRAKRWQTVGFGP